MRRSWIIIAAFLLAGSLFAQQTPNPLWTQLEQSNAVFARGGTLPINVSDRQPGGQNPPVTVLSCADSRVPPELIFNRPPWIGALFVVRTAGNVASPFDIASIEYAISPQQNAPQGWTRLIVVMGHSDCGAVKAALTGGPGGSGSLDALLERIRESFVGIRPWSPANLRAATVANARYSAAYLVAHSRIIRDATTRAVNPVAIIPAYYDLGTGRVTRVD